MPRLHVSLFALAASVAAMPLTAAQADYTTGLELWLKSDTIAANNGDPVGLWTDSSGNAGRDATQVGAAQPTYLANQINGLPALDFDPGSAEFMSVVSDPVWALSDFHMTAVLKIDPGGASAAWWTRSWLAQDDGGGPNKKWIWSFDLGTGKTVFHINGPGTGGPVLEPAGTWSPNGVDFYLLEVAKNGFNYSFYLNGVLQGTVVDPSSNATLPDAVQPLNIGFAEGGTFDGKIAEIRIYGDNLTEAQRGAAGGALEAKYGLDTAYLVPEPASLLALAAGGVMLLRRRA